MSKLKVYLRRTAAEEVTVAFSKLEEVVGLEKATELSVGSTVNINQKVPVGHRRRDKLVGTNMVTVNRADTILAITEAENVEVTAAARRARLAKVQPSPPEKKEE